jgi:hypothetical protein
MSAGLSPRSWRHRPGLTPFLVLTPDRRDLYIVHMRRVTASEARREWFRLLDEAARGEVIMIQRKGCRLVLRREETRNARGAPPDARYRRLLRVPRADQADRWSWQWKPERGLIARPAPPR